MQLHCKQTHEQAYVEQAYKKTTLKQRYKSDVFSDCGVLHGGTHWRTMLQQYL